MELEIEFKQHGPSWVPIRYHFHPRCFAVWEIERTKQHMTEIMMEASRVVTGGVVIPVDVEDIVCAPQCLGDVRQPEDFPMWQEVRTLVKQKAA